MASIAHQDVSPAPAPRAGWQGLAQLRRVGSGLLIVGMLAGIAWWGHSHGWSVPKFSALAGSDEAPVEAWCPAHNVPSSICIECRPDLLPAAPAYGWCKEHGVANCPLEHPDVVQTAEAFVVTPEMRERAARALAVRPRPENNSRCTLHVRRIQFASPEAVAKAGVDVDVVAQERVVEAISANGEVVYDQTRMAHLASRVAGTVWRVEKQVGDRVNRGELLALVDAAEVGRAKSDLLQAMAQARLQDANVARIAPLVYDGIIGERQLQEAEAARSQARIRVATAQQALVNLGLPIDVAELGDASTDEIAEQIRFLGIPEAIVDSLDPGSTTSNLFPLRASIEGVIVARHVVEGEVVDASKTLFEVADIERLWLMLSVRQEDAPLVTVGQPVLFRPGDNSAQEEVSGSVGWISTAADDETRTVAVRVDLPNAGGRLRANTFGTGRIVLREEAQAVVVPSEAVHWDGNCYVVFVRDKHYFDEGAPKYFHVRSVRPGVKQRDVTEIIAGLAPGEVIASRNSVVLEAQLLKANLGAGCGCTDGH